MSRFPWSRRRVWHSMWTLVAECARNGQALRSVEEIRDVLARVDAVYSSPTVIADAPDEGDGSGVRFPR